MPLTLQKLHTLDTWIQAGLDRDEHDRRAWFNALAIDDDEMRSLLERALFSDRNVSTDTFLDRPPQIAAEMPLRDDLHQGTTIGGYTLEEPLGEGGSASVWRARRSDGNLKRDIALKLPFFIGNTRGWHERAMRERDILASLQHPNIATIHDAGVEANGRPWLALELIDGAPIDRQCREKSLDANQRIALVVRVARAVEYAHARGIIHRDLKPGNILIDQNGQPKLLDFGIAKLLDTTESASHGGEPTMLTRLHGRPFTPEYASPEQQRGEAITTGVDIYALAVVLHELIVGTRPHRSDSGVAWVDLRHQPSDYPLDSAKIRRDLYAIEQKALHIDATKRYGTMSAFADDLERYLKNEPVLAQPDSGWYRLLRFLHRNKLAVGASTAVLASLIGGLGAAGWQAREANLQRLNAESEARNAATAALEADAQRKSADLARVAATESADRALQSAEAMRRANEVASNERNIALERTSRAIESERRATEALTEKALEIKKTTAVKDFVASLIQAGDVDIVESAKKRNQTIETLLRDALPQVEANLAGQRDVKVELLTLLADVYAKLRMYPEAKQAVEQKITALSEKPTKDIPALADAFSDLAIFDSNVGNRAAGLGHVERALQIIGDANDRLMQKTRIRALAIRGQFKSFNGQFAQGLEDASVAVRLAEATQTGSPEYLTALNALTLALAGLGRDAEANATVQRAISVSTAINGASSTTTSALRHNWSEHLFRQNSVGPAIEQARLALSGFESKYGRDNYSTARTQAWLGRMLSTRGDSVEAVSQLTAAIDTLSRLEGKIDIQQIATPQTWLAYAHMERGHIEDAEPWATRAASRYPDSQARSSASAYINTHMGLGIYSMNSGAYTRAVDIFSKVEELMLQIGAGSNPARWIARANRASALLNLGKYDEASLLAEEVFKATDQASGGSTSARNAAILVLADASLSASRMRDARAQLDRVDRYLQALTPQERPFHYLLEHRVLLLQGKVDLASGDFASAEQRFRAALSLVDTRHPTSSVHRGNALAHLGLAKSRRSEIEDARTLFASAQSVFRSHPKAAPHFSAAFRELGERVSRP
jgi:eukaryotic-like serine/threonine-protein kinase